MDNTVKAAVAERKADLDARVKAQETKAKTAKANSAKGTGPSKADENGNTADEHWTANMPGEHLQGYIAKKVNTVVKK